MAMREVDGIHPTIFQGLHTILSVSPDRIDGSSSFITLGGDSLAAVRLAAYCTERQLPVRVREILKSSRIDQILKKSGESTSPGLKPQDRPPISPIPSVIKDEHQSSKSLQQTRPTVPLQSDLNSSSVNDQFSFQEDAFTEMQLSFIHHNENSLRTNIIRFCETYLSTALPGIQRAWRVVMDLEAIFRPPGLHSGSDVTPHQWKDIKVNSEHDYNAELAKAKRTQTRLSCFRSVTWEKENSSDSISTVVWCVHHAFIDGYSAYLLHRKMVDVANGYIRPPGPSFWTVALELKKLRQDRRDATKRFWASKYSSFGSAAWEIKFPPLRIVEEPIQEVSDLTLRFPHERIIDCATAIGVTPAAFYCSAWGLALSKLMNNDQVSFGMVFSGRDLPITNIQDTIGPCLNTLPLFISTAQPETMDSSTYVQTVFQTLDEYSTFQLALSEDGLIRQYSSIMAFQYNMALKDCESLQAIRPIGSSSFSIDSDIPVSVLIFEHGVVQIRFNRDCYNTNNMQILGDMFQNAMEALLHRENSILSCLDQILSPEKRVDVLHTSNANTLSTFNKYDGYNDDIVTYFERTASHYPDDIAVAKGSETITYRSFDLAADLVARSLTLIKPGEPVCIIADRSINWLVAIFGILKARGVYVPLDPNVPQTVRDENFKRCGARIFIATTESAIPVGPSTALELLVVEDILRPNQQPPPVEQYARRTTPTPDHPAYISFTSGSTGKPKAVQCTHKGLFAFIASKEIRMHSEHGIWIAQTMSPVFDGSILEVFSSLCYGATLCLPEENAGHPFEHLERCDAVLLTPSVGKVLNPCDYPRLKHVYMVGEPVPQYVADQWSKEKNLYNMYGPTESTCGATLKRLIPREKVSIGYPNPSSRVYILDRNQQLMPIGTVGEIYTAGVQVSQGYLGQPNETAHRFSADSVMLDPDERMYRTGDLGYWDTETKELYCMGRADRQIKLRGFRLNLQDLEVRTARAIPESTGVAVYRKEDCLIAVMQPASLDISSVRSRLLKCLPGYAVPHRIIAMDVFPLTNAGKLNYKALESLLETSAVVEPDRSVLQGTERIVAQAWKEILNLGPETEIFSHTDFIAVGGHSLSQIKLANLLSRKFKRPISIKTIIENPIINGLAQAIDASATDSLELSRPGVGETLGVHGISPIERDWLSKYNNAQSGTSAFNVSRVYELDATTVNYENLCRSWDRVLARHKILRSRFINHAGGVRIHQDNGPRIEFMLELDVRKLVNHEFELDKECPVRITVSPRYLVICISHIVCDLTTLSCLLDEFFALYRGYLPSAPLNNYEDTCWDSKDDGDLRAFWRLYLPEPKDDMRSRDMKKYIRSTFRGTSYAYQLAPSSQQMLRSMINTYNLTHHQAALAVVSLALGSVLSSDVVLGSPWIGRSEEDEKTIGLFLQPLPIRIPKTSIGTPLHEFLASIRTSSQTALAHAMSWSAILECINYEPDLSSSLTHPLLDIMITFHDEREEASKQDLIVGFEELATWSEGAKFPLMFEFTQTKTALMLRLEYSSELFQEQEVVRLVKSVELVLLGIGGCSVVGEVVSGMNEGHGASGGREVDMGRKYCDL